MRHGGRQFDHLIGLSDVVNADTVYQQRALRAIEQRLDQQRLQLVAAQIVEDLADLKAQERFVFQRLYRPLCDLLKKLRARFGGEGQLQQTRRLRGGSEGKKPV